MIDNSLLEIDLMAEKDDEVIVMVEEIMEAEGDLIMNQKLWWKR